MYYKQTSTHHLRRLVNYYVQTYYLLPFYYYLPIHTLDHIYSVLILLILSLSLEDDEVLVSPAHFLAYLDTDRLALVLL